MICSLIDLKMKLFLELIRLIAQFLNKTGEIKSNVYRDIAYRYYYWSIQTLY